MLVHREVTCGWYSLGMASYQKQERTWMLNDTRTQQLAMDLASLEEEKSPKLFKPLLGRWFYYLWLNTFHISWWVYMWTLRVLGSAGCVKSSWNSKVPCPVLVGDKHNFNIRRQSYWRSSMDTGDDIWSGRFCLKSPRKFSRTVPIGVLSLPMQC